MEQARPEKWKKKSREEQSSRKSSGGREGSFDGLAEVMDQQKVNFRHHRSAGSENNERSIGQAPAGSAAFPEEEQAFQREIPRGIQDLDNIL